LKPFSFIHAADLHLGYSQYGLEARRQDFDEAFKELVDRAIELKPDFMIIAGDLFHQARPSNHTLENTIRSFKRLKDAGIPVLTVDGSHDSAPNTITSTILYPLDSAGLIIHLPRHQGACWSKQECCYVYGIPTYHNRHKTQEALPKFMADNPPTPKAGVANIFVFHGALDLPSVKGPFEAEILPDEKAKAIKKFQKENEIVAMVGDGINDSPALAQSDIGIALGTGTDIAIESSSIIIIRNDLNALVSAIQLSKKTIKTIKQNLFWAFFYNVICIPLAALGLLNPMFAALAMSLSSVSVVSNSLRIKNFKPEN